MMHTLEAFDAEHALNEVACEDRSFVVDTYLCDTPLQLETMRSAVAGRDLPMLSRAARSLRSSSERVGALEVARIAQRLGAVVGYRGSADDCALLIGRLQAAFEKIAPQLHLLAHRS